jgi:hypothetical protein
MTAVTAKIVCTTKTVQSDGSANLSFSPDYADARNKQWAAATPSLSLSMTVKGDVEAEFEQGDKYTLTFEPNDD